MKFVLTIIGILAILVSIIFFGFVFEKSNNFYNLKSNVEEYEPYIINATYFNGYAVLAIGFLLIGLFCIAQAHVMYRIDKNVAELNKIKSSIDNIRIDTAKYNL